MFSGVEMPVRKADKDHPCMRFSLDHHAVPQPGKKRVPDHRMFEPDLFPDPPYFRGRQHTGRDSTALPPLAVAEIWL
jgi:hypothetical protein